MKYIKPVSIVIVSGIVIGLIVMGIVVGGIPELGPSNDTHNSSYTISVEQVDDTTTIENETVIEYSELSTEQQRQFDKALEGRFKADSLVLEPSSNVRYNGTVYTVVVAAA